ncbi:MAG: hypothetical protein ACRC7O_11870, partial [Fimbriiglobus sp.]
GVRVVSAAMIVGLGFWAGVVGLVVWFALDNEPIAGNAVQFGGVSVVTWAGLLIALTAPLAGAVISANVFRAELAKLAAEPPDPPDAEAEKFATVFGTGTFLEFAIAESAAGITALLYHLTADAVMLAALIVPAAVLIARFPTAGRARRWYDAAEADVARTRAESTT